MVTRSVTAYAAVFPLLVGFAASPPACSKAEPPAETSQVAPSSPAASAGGPPMASGSGQGQDAPAPGAAGMAPVTDAGSAASAQASSAASPARSGAPSVAPAGVGAAATGGRGPSAPTAASAASAPAASAPSTPAPVVLHPAAARSTSPRWAIDFTTAGCASGTDCVATLHVQAQGAFHVNPEYHFRFVPDSVSGVTFSGGTPADFARDGAKDGTLTLHYTAAASGPVTLSGAFKICVCTDDLCAPESVTVSLLVPVS